jgi:hypothetical protein
MHQNYTGVDPTRLRSDRGRGRLHLEWKSPGSYCASNFICPELRRKIKQADGALKRNRLRLLQRRTNMV